MKLSEIKGKKQLKVVGRLMSLADSLGGEEAFDAFLEGAKDGDTSVSAFLKLGPFLERDDVADALVDIIAYAKDVEPGEVDNPLGELAEMLTSDVELPGFLSQRR